MTFQTGQLVRCVRAAFQEGLLTYGNTYKVLSVIGGDYPRIAIIGDHGQRTTQATTRFEAAEEVLAEPGSTLPGENPKARFGAAKSPLALIPATAEIMIAEVFALGATKYGPFNWRVTGVEAMTYAHAAKRHLAAWVDGQDVDPESGQPHLAHVAACMAILMDASACGKLDDNRPPRGPAAELIAALTKKVD